jgi:C4-type Zn-finger protein
MSQQKMNFLFSIQLIILFVFTLNLLILLNPIHNAFSDGLFEEKLPPASVGDREASLYTKINPPILTSDSKENAFFELRLFDAKTDETVEHTSYFIAVEKNDKLLMRDLFHSHQGTLKLKINPTTSESISVFGSTEPFLGGWTSETGDITINGPLLLEGGLYHFAIEIFGIDNDRNIFTPENAPRFDSWLSVGDVYRDDITDSGKNYNITLISYYDQIQNFKYDSQQSNMSWIMPFNWDIKRIQDNNIFVHEEIKIPKTLTKFSETNAFDALVNGNPLVGRSIALDPFTEEKNFIIHLLLNKADVIKIAETVNNNTNANNATNNNNTNGTMTFSLSPAEQKIAETTSEVVSDIGGILVKFNWGDEQILSNQDTNVQLDFSDALSTEKINGDIKYDIIVYDKSGNKIVTKQELIAKNAKDSQIIKFPSKGIYQIEIHIKGITYPDVGTPDETRNGIARGTVVVT